VVVGMREEFIRRSICGLEKAWRLMKSKSRNKDVMVKATVIVDLEGLCRKHYTHYDGINKNLWDVTGLTTFLGIKWIKLCGA